MFRQVLPASLLAVALMACAGDGSNGVPQTNILADAADPALSPDGSRLAWSKSIAGQAKIHVSAADGSSPVRLTNGTWDSNPAWSPDGKWIAYVGESPNFDVWVVAADGGDPRQLTSTPLPEQVLGWLPDASGVAILQLQAGGVQSLVAPLDGGALRPLLPAVAGNIAALPSPDGKWIAFNLVRGSESTIWVQDATGGAARQLTSEGLESLNLLERMWSPDSRRVAYTSTRTGTADIWTVDVVSGERQQVTTDVRNDRNPSWSPDGRWIAFNSDRGGQRDVWIAPAGGGDAIRVTNDIGMEDSPGWSPDGQALYFARLESEGSLSILQPAGQVRELLRWTGATVTGGYVTASPDGSTLLFAGDRSGNLDIWQVAAAGGDPVPFAAGPLDEWEPRYSPDGRAVAFISTRGGSEDIWIVSASGGEPRRLTEWAGRESSLAWSPDGQWIAFTSDREAALSELWVVPAAGGAPRRLTTLNRLLIGRPSWSPDGRTIYVQSLGEPATLHAVPFAGGRPRNFALLASAPFGGVLSPDGKTYAFAAVNQGWATMWLLPTDGSAAPRQISPRAEKVWHPFPLWSRDGTKLVASDWQFGDRIDTELLELTPSTGTERVLAQRPLTSDNPELFLPNGDLVFSSSRSNRNIVKVSVAALLIGK